MAVIALLSVDGEEAMAVSFEIVGEHDLATNLGVSIWTLRTWRRKGFGPPAHKLGKKVIYSKADVDGFVAGVLNSGGHQ